MSQARAERCVCGGIIVANADSPGPAVLAHNRSPKHEAWRLGYTAEALPSALPSADGQPVMRFSPMERLGRGTL